MEIKPHQRINKQTDSDGIQRVHPKTHCSGIGKSMGLQWVLSDATLCTSRREPCASRKEGHVVTCKPLLLLLHAAFEFNRLEVLSQPGMDVSPRLNVEPVPIVVGELPHERKERVVELGRKGRAFT